MLRSAGRNLRALDADRAHMNVPHTRTTHVLKHYSHYPTLTSGASNGRTTLAGDLVTTTTCVLGPALPALSGRGAGAAACGAYTNGADSSGRGEALLNVTRLTPSPEYVLIRPTPIPSHTHTPHTHTHFPLTGCQRQGTAAVEKHVPAAWLLETVFVMLTPTYRLSLWSGFFGSALATAPAAPK